MLRRHRHPTMIRKSLLVELAEMLELPLHAGMIQVNGCRLLVKITILGIFVVLSRMLMRDLISFTECASSRSLVHSLHRAASWSSVAPVEQAEHGQHGPGIQPLGA